MHVTTTPRRQIAGLPDGPRAWEEARGKVLAERGNRYGRMILKSGGIMSDVVASVQERVKWREPEVGEC